MRSTLIPFAILLLTARLVPAQSSAAKPLAATAGDAATTTLRTGANLVLVDVVVSRKGKPVQGLQQSQFQVLENGKPQSLSSFEEHRPRRSPAGRHPCHPAPTVMYPRIPLPAP